MFQLTNEEFLNLRSQFVPSKSDLIGLRRSPYAFIEGIVMLASVLKTYVALEVSIRIMLTFVVI